jgi:hypothetical protein
MTFTDLRTGSESDPLTGEERNAITALERLARRWPQSLMLFSWSGSLCVIRNGDALLDDPGSAVIAQIDGIPNDGGDP